MFDRILLDNDAWLMTVALLGGITVHLKAKHITRQASREGSRHFVDTVEALKNKGVMITPGNPVLEELFEFYAEAIVFRGGLKWQAAFIVMTPESIVNGFRLEQKSWFNVFKPMSLCVALAKRVSAYVEAVDSGKKLSPAYQHKKDDSLFAIWRDIRLEALRHLWNYGTSESVLLADSRRQRNLLDAFFENISQHEFPLRPPGNSVYDTLQALFQVYIYLYKAGMMVADRETLSLSHTNETLFSGFERRVKVLWAEWIVYEDAVHASGAIPKMPCTLLEVLYSDVTRRAKSIAFSATYGPSYRFTWDYMEELIIKDLQEQGESQDNIDKKVKHTRSIQEKLLDADDPDQSI